MQLLLATSKTALSGEGVYNYGLVIFLMMTGLYLVLSKGNMIKSIIGLNLFQVSVIMFYVSMGRIDHGTAPILLEKDLPHHEDAHDVDGDSEGHGSILQKDTLFLASAGDTHSDGSAVGNVAQRSSERKSIQSRDSAKFSTVYSNPLPHVLMLTAIVVGVATTALALSLVIRIREYFGTIEEDELDVNRSTHSVEVQS